MSKFSNQPIIFVSNQIKRDFLNPFNLFLLSKSIKQKVIKMNDYTELQKQSYDKRFNEIKDYKIKLLSLYLTIYTNKTHIKMKPFFKDMLKYISKRKQLTINQFNSLIPYLLNEDILTKLKHHRPFTVFNLENEIPIKNKYHKISI